MQYKCTLSFNRTFVVATVHSIIMHAVRSSMYFIVVWFRSIFLKVMFFKLLQCQCREVGVGGRGNPLQGQSHYNDVIMPAMASQITSLTIVYSTVYSRRRSKKTSTVRVTGFCEGKSPVTSYAENVSIWWRHHNAIHQTPVELSNYNF